MNLLRFCLEILKLTEENLEECQNIMVVLPQMADDCENDKELLVWDADISEIKFDISEGRVVLKTY